MKFFVGTSGYSYLPWRGSFYPAKFPAAKMLEFYSRRLPAVELNNSFYRLPAANVVAQWAGEAPASFRFVMKAPQTITHRKRLSGAEEATDEFLATAALLGRRLGPLFFQLPPNMKQDLSRLDAFLKYLKKRAAVAFEFRHPSWFDEQTYDCLRAHRAALCIADAEELPPQRPLATADWGYLRLRRENYTDAQLRSWLKKIRACPWRKVYVFFKHEDTGTGPRLAARLLELAAKQSK